MSIEVSEFDVNLRFNNCSRSFFSNSRRCFFCCQDCRAACGLKKMHLDQYMLLYAWNILNIQPANVVYHILIGLLASLHLVVEQLAL